MTCDRQLYSPSAGSRAMDFDRPWPGLNLRILGRVASTLPLDHRGREAMMPQVRIHFRSLAS
jgi:hypothetical protein